MFTGIARLTSPAVVALVLAGCGAGGGAAGDSDSDALQVAAAFYPLEFVTERVGGEAVDVTNLTRPGAEPHDLELDPRDVAGLSEADLVVYLSGFQPAVDDAVASQDVEALDVAEAAALMPPADVHDHGDAVDPHFWLDPLRLADAADAVAERLAGIDPDDAQVYRDRARALREDLEALDRDFTEGLASCEVDHLVTAHSAFGYLADRYAFVPVGISGLDAENEPDPRTVADVSDLVRKHGVSTVYTETLVDPAVAETVATEAGVRTAVLDPVEGVTQESAGEDYLEIMRANLEVLREGQRCT